VEVDVADAVGQQLVGVTVHHGAALEARQQRLHLGSVDRPEVPGLVEVVQRRVAEDEHRRVVGVGLEVALEPGALLGAHLEVALAAVVEAGDGLHALHRRQPALGPEVLLDHAVQHHTVHALVIPRVDVLAEQVAPALAHVEVPVVLADHHLHRRLQLLQDLCAELELLGLAPAGPGRRRRTRSRAAGPSRWRRPPPAAASG
jgi:hypothetical protein